MTWGEQREGLALNEADLGVTGELQKGCINFFSQFLAWTYTYIKK